MIFSRIALILAMACILPTANATDYTLTLLAPTGATRSDAWDVNNLGQVVGSYSAPGFKYSHAFVWSVGGFSVLTGPTGSLSANALGVSDGGTVVGAYSTTEVDDGTGTLTLGPSQGFIYTAGAYTSFSVFGAESTGLRGISPDGRYISGTFNAPSSNLQGFLFDRTSGTTTVFGSATAAGSQTIVQGINSAYQLVGDERLPTVPGSPATSTSFIFDIVSGKRVDHNLPGATRTAYRDISSDGVVAGWARVAAGTQGFVGGPASFPSFSFGAFGSTILEGLNDSGWLVGDYQNDSYGNTQAFLLTPVPEPGTAVLALAGGVGLWAWRRRGNVW